MNDHWILTNKPDRALKRVLGSNAFDNWNDVRKSAKAVEDKACSLVKTLESADCRQLRLDLESALSYFHARRAQCEGEYAALGRGEHCDIERILALTQVYQTAIELLRVENERVGLVIGAGLVVGWRASLLNIPIGALESYERNLSLYVDELKAAKRTMREAYYQLFLDGVLTAAGVLLSKLRLLKLLGQSGKAVTSMFLAAVEWKYDDKLGPNSLPAEVRVGAKMSISLPAACDAADTVLRSTRARNFTRATKGIAQGASILLFDANEIRVSASKVRELELAMRRVQEDMRRVEPVARDVSLRLAGLREDARRMRQHVKDLQLQVEWIRDMVYADSQAFPLKR